MNDIVKIVKSLEASGLLIKGVSNTKEQKGRFLGMLSGTLGASLLRNLLITEGEMRASEGKIRTCKGTIREGQDF